MQTSVKGKITVGILAALTVAGVAAWIYQLVGGLGVTGMNNGTSWGLYIICFMFFVGLSAGGLIVASSASVFKVKEYEKVALPAVILSTVCICLAGMFVLIDLGGIHRVLQIMMTPNIASPLFWDICVIVSYLAINIIYIYFMVSKRSDSPMVSIVSRFALPVAILVHSVTAWIFGLEIAKEGWHSAIMAPLFIASALDSGLALLILSLLGLKKTKVFNTDKRLIANLAGLLAACIAIDAFLIGCELLTVAYPQTTGGMALLNEMLTGSTALFFWGEIILGLFIPFCILVFAKNRQKTGFVMLSSILVIVGVFFKRVWLLVTSFVHANIYGAPGISSGSSEAIHAAGTDAWALVSAYIPTWVEIVVVVGVISFGVLAFILLSKYFFTKVEKTASDGCNSNTPIIAAQTTKALS